MDRWMESTGESLKETRILGMQIRPWLRESISYSDNIFYQERNEKLVVDNDPPPSIDPTPGPASPKLGKPRGQVDDFVNTLAVGVGLEKPLNVTLLKALGLSREGGNSFRFFDASVTYVEYLTESSGPDALNWNVKADIPNLIDLTNVVSKLLRMDAHTHAVYFRLETGFSRTTDPLDVAIFDFQSTAPTLFTRGQRNDFTRQEWYVKPTLGFQGPAWDWALSYRYFNFSILDEDLDVADHVEHDFSATLGRSFKDQRIYVYDRYAIFKFEARGPNDETPVLRNFVLNEIGAGWGGPISWVSKKLSGTAEVGYADQDVEDEHTPPFVTGKVGGPLPFDEHHGMVGRGSLTYRPYVTKATQFKLEYDRHVDWSVVSTNKVVDTGTFTFSHPFNPKFRTEWKYMISHETVATREKRLYQEADIAFMYQIMHYTELEFRYTYRKMISTGEPTTSFADASNQIYFIQPDGDFTANIFTIGISVSF
jgi:hypothetical protein